MLVRPRFVLFLTIGQVGDRSIAIAGREVACLQRRFLCQEQIRSGLGYKESQVGEFAHESKRKRSLLECRMRPVANHQVDTLSDQVIGGGANQIPRMLRHRLKEIPVVDEDGRVVSDLTMVDLLQTADLWRL